MSKVRWQPSPQPMEDGSWKCTILEERWPGYTAGKLPTPDHQHMSRAEAIACAEARIAEAMKPIEDD